MIPDWETHRRAFGAALNLAGTLERRGVWWSEGGPLPEYHRMALVEAWNALLETMPAILAEEGQDA